MAARITWTLSSLPEKMKKRLPNFSILNLLLVIACGCCVFATLYEHHNSVIRVQQIKDESHLAWGAASNAIATIEMAKVSLNTEGRLKPAHKRLLLNALGRLLNNQHQIDNYTDNFVPLSTTLASRILELLDIEAVEQLPVVVADSFETKTDFFWDEQRNNISSDMIEFVESAILSPSTANAG